MSSLQGPAWEYFTLSPLSQAHPNDESEYPDPVAELIARQRELYPCNRPLTPEQLQQLRQAQEEHD